MWNNISKYTIWVKLYCIVYEALKSDRTALEELTNIRKTKEYEKNSTKIFSLAPIYSGRTFEHDVLAGRQLFEMGLSKLLKISTSQVHYQSWSLIQTMLMTTLLHGYDTQQNL